MAYTTRTDLEAYLPRRGGEPAFAPLTTAQADVHIDGIAAQLDAVLAELGLSVPVTLAGAPTLYNLLAELNAWGAAAGIQRARFQDQGGANMESAWSFFEERYKAGLATLSDTARGIVGAPSGIRPASYTTRNPDEDEHLGANAEPTLSPAALKW